MLMLSYIKKEGALLDNNTKKLFVGIYLLIIGVFLPWYSVSTSYTIDMPGLLGDAGQTLVAGYKTVPGLVILFISVLMLILAFIPTKSDMTLYRVYVAQVFLASLAGGLFLIGGFIPAFVYFVDYPHIGLLALFLGCLILGVSLKNGYRGIDHAGNSSNQD